VTRNDVQISEHFKASEAECPCCGLLVLRPQILVALERIRADRKRGPLLATSWCRCEKDNERIYADKNFERKIAGLKPFKTPNSPHLVGCSNDIVDGGGWAVDLPVVYTAADIPYFRSLGVRGLGIGNNFIHIDFKPRDGEQFRAWTYDFGKPTRLVVVDVDGSEHWA